MDHDMLNLPELLLYCIMHSLGCSMRLPQGKIRIHSDLQIYIHLTAKFAGPEKEFKLLAWDLHRCPEPGYLLKEGDVITLGETDLRVIETPGHTAGGICFATDREVFTGDTLFRLSVGRTDLPTGDWYTLVDSIKNKLYTLDDEMVVYPGHGGPTTIGYEKRANPFV